MPSSIELESHEKNFNPFGKSDIGDADNADVATSAGDTDLGSLKNIGSYIYS